MAYFLDSRLRGNDNLKCFNCRIAWNYEIIAVNDGSVDNTLEILKRLAEQNGRLKVVSYSKNISRGNALRDDSKALAFGYYLKQIPAILTGRDKGRSKFKLRKTTLSHMVFSAFERLMIIFGFIGVF